MSNQKDIWQYLVAGNLLSFLCEDIITWFEKICNKKKVWFSFVFLKRKKDINDQHKVLKLFVSNRKVVGKKWFHYPVENTN